MLNVNLRKVAAGTLFAVAVAAPILLPTNAAAQTSHRQKQKNQWRNLGIAGAAAGVLGLVTHNKTLTYGGLAGGAYSAYRYEQDRRSQRREQDRYNSWRYRNHNGYNGRAQRFHGSSSYRRTPHGYVSHGYAPAYHHDNGRHLGWTKHR